MAILIIFAVIILASSRYASSSLDLLLAYGYIVSKSSLVIGNSTSSRLPV